MRKFFKLLILIFALWLHVGNFTFLEGAIPQAERGALIALYYQAGGDYWSDKTNWLGAPGSENTWFGVTVETVNGEEHVTKLSLIANNLTGTIPAEIAGLTRLQYLSLDHNYLSGVIPQQITTLTSLRRLVLDDNRLTGNIPPSIGTLDKLESLGLKNNQLEGHLPAELGNLHHLEKLRLAANRLTGPIPTGLKNLSVLANLEIEFNGLYTTDSSLKAFLDNLSPGWEQTQTTAPTGISVTKQTASSVEVKWTPIDFTAHEGYYEVLYRTGPDANGVYESLGKTPNKSVTSLMINNLVLLPGNSYYFVLRTKTFPHENNINEVLSDESSEYELEETAFTMTIQSVPAVGASISVSPADIHGESSGTTNFSRTYAPGTTVTLTAAEQLNNIPFRQWEILGVGILPAVYRREITVVMDSDLQVTAIYKQPEIYINPTYFNFGGTSNGVSTPAQEFLIGNRGGGLLEWSIDTETSSWLAVTPTSGTCTAGSSQYITAAVNTRRMDEQRYEGFILINAPGAANSPQKIKVILNVIDDSEDQPPFGSFEMPRYNTTVSGSIPISGWALDDTGIDRVQIYVEDIRDAPGQKLYIGDAVFVQGARPDVEAAYSHYPMNHKAGWGYMLLTNALNDRSNPDKTFKIHVTVTDIGQNEVSLGTKTITIDNRNAVKPFGAIDSPTQGGTVSGSSYRNLGWVLTPPGDDRLHPVKIPEDGSTIVLYIDGKKKQEGATYNIFRGDTAGLFPGYANSEGSQVEFLLDTAALSNGQHTIAWTVEDSAGHSDGIGSRFFSVRNIAGTDAADTAASYTMNPSQHLETGDIQGNIQYNVEIEVPGRVEIHFPPAGKPCRYSGFLKVGDSLKPLPIGSTLDTVAGVFYWQVGPGFHGTYELVFLRTDMKSNNTIKIPVNVVVLPWGREIYLRIMNDDRMNGKKSRRNVFIEH
ncbi:MAG: Ig-like domain-containing protein [Acidobacteria bacterium]|jgi:hypothetical protein|nr:Ig-like domain-containing protein [Acidobacteriota bacterium]